MNQELENLMSLITELTMKVDGLQRRESEMREALQYLSKQAEEAAKEDLNRDVRLSLIEGRLDGVDKA